MRVYIIAGTITLVGFGLLAWLTWDRAPCTTEIGAWTNPECGK